MLDKLFVNGKIHTMVSPNDIYSSLGVRDGLIEYVGDEQNIPSKEVIDLHGKTMIPGMADSHLHLYAHCQNLTYVDLSNVKSIKEMIDKMKEKADKTEEGQWIKGVNFDQTKWSENRFPTLDEMNSISEVHPIVIKRTCLHCVVANSLGLKIAGIERYATSELGGKIELDDDGYPTGILREQTTKIFDDILPNPLENNKIRDEIFQAALSDMSSKGITTIHTYAAQIWQYNEDINIYRNFEKQNKLPLRVTVCLDNYFEQEKISPTEFKNPYRLTQYGAFKIFTDGSLGSESAALREPYANNPNAKGLLISSRDELIKLITEAYIKGYQPAIHAIGDRALDITLDAIETAVHSYETHNPGKSASERLPFRIIHAEIADLPSIERMAKLPVVIDMQPTFICTDLHWLEYLLGSSRAQNSYPMKTMMEKGLILTGGSDCPVETYDPIIGVYAAVTRQDLDGTPLNGFLPNEKLDVFKALSMFTKNVHYATGQEKYLGTLEKGKFADLVVLNEDIFSVAENKIKDIKIEQTYLAGSCVYMVQ